MLRLAQGASRVGALRQQPFAVARRWMASSSATLSESIEQARAAAEAEEEAAEAGQEGNTEPRRVWTMEKHVRHSPKRMNMLCTQIRGLYVDEAHAQMFLSKKRMSRLVRNTIRKAANLADIRHDLKPSQLVVKEAVVGIGGRLKRIRPMGRGRAGRVDRMLSHLRIVLEEAPSRGVADLVPKRPPRRLSHTVEAEVLGGRTVAEIYGFQLERRQ